MSLLSTAALAVVTLAAVPQLLGITTGLDPATVTSGSMVPEIQVGDVILTRPAAAPVAGDVIRFAAPPSVTAVDPTIHTVTHRVVSRTDDGMLVTRGDANGADDADLVAPAHVIGRVEKVLPGAGVVALHVRSYLWLLVGVLLLNVHRDQPARSRR